MAERPRRKAASVDALKNGSAQDPEICTVVARLFAEERRLDKARAWFQRATLADPDNGDAWAWWLRFERQQQSNSDKVDGVEAACEAAKPRHGQVWPSVSKDPANYGLSAIQILRLVADALAKSRTFA
ncbi:U4/U6 x U5 tri-snRNP complex subunit Prp1 [Coemansia aciculifera]|nr:U4/U6 x U5 tri-snRNP complex subunit Prp1 [Coemansia aciculifera]